MRNADMVSSSLFHNVTLTTHSHAGVFDLIASIGTKDSEPYTRFA